MWYSYGIVDGGIMKNIILGVLLFSSSLWAQNTKDNGAIDLKFEDVNISFSYSAPNLGEDFQSLNYRIVGKAIVQKPVHLECLIAGIVSYHANSPRTLNTLCGDYVIRINTKSSSLKEPIRKYKIGITVQIDSREGKSLKTVYGPDFHQIREFEAQESEVTPTINSNQYKK